MQGIWRGWRRRGNLYIISVVKRMRKRLLGRSRRRCENNSSMNVKKKQNGMTYSKIYLAEDTNKWRVVLSMVTHFQVA